jgi:superfamily I DNA/RNA helicase
MGIAKLGLLVALYRPSVPWRLSFLVNTLLSVLNFLRLKKAGHRSLWLGLAATLLTPIYLFARAKRLKQPPFYAIAWIISLILGGILLAAASINPRPFCSQMRTSRSCFTFSRAVIDEAQDLGVPELRMLAAVTPNGPDTLFFAGDLGQRIFQEPFSWKALGVDIRGRSRTLKVNYRTSHQIRQAADRLLPKIVQDVDGNEQDRRGTVSVFNGPDPEIRTYANAEREIEGIADWIKKAVADGIAPAEIGIFVRSSHQLARARGAVKAAGHTQMELSERLEQPQGRVSIGIMHLAKGLEYKAVAVIACDDDVLPLQERVETIADESELDEVYETERHLFYVACTRARDQLLLSGVDPASEFFRDLEKKR